MSYKFLLFEISRSWLVQIYDKKLLKSLGFKGFSNVVDLRELGFACQSLCSAKL